MSNKLGRFDWIARDSKSSDEVHYMYNYEKDNGEVLSGLVFGDDRFYTREEWEELKEIIDDIFEANEG